MLKKSIFLHKTRLNRILYKFNYASKFLLLMIKMIRFITILSLVTFWASCQKKDIAVMNQQVLEPNVPMFDTITGLNASGTEMLDFRDNNSYHVIHIGQKYWLAQNLRYNIPNSLVYPNISEQQYGRLYPWDVLMKNDSSTNANPSNIQGICPQGWHLPSNEEWKELIDTVSFSGTLSTHTLVEALKSTSDWYTYTDYSGNTINTNGTNSSGLNLYPSGYSTPYSNTHHYDGFSSISIFWSASEFSPSKAYFFELRNSITHYYREKDFAYSCRCVLN
jgi:uncharacterized protein (TIGR02145 family)